MVNLNDVTKKGEPAAMLVYAVTGLHTQDVEQVQNLMLANSRECVLRRCRLVLVGWSEHVKTREWLQSFDHSANSADSSTRDPP